MINLTKLVREGLQPYDQPDNTPGALRDDDVVLSQIKLEVVPGSINWSNTSQTGIPSQPRTVNITKSNTASPEAFGQVQAVKEDQHFIRVILEKGIVRGVNRQMKLPLDTKNQQELIKAFGPHVEINPGKPVSEPLLNKLKIGVAVEGALGPRGATAQLTNKEKEYKGHFTVKVMMYGKGLASGMERQVGDIIEDLKSARPSDDDLRALTVTRRSRDQKKVVEFTMQGELECKWDSEHTVEWKENS